MRIMVLGATGMLGNAMMRVLGEREDWGVFGTVRSGGASRLFPDEIAGRLVAGVDVENFDALAKAFATIRPDVVVNCVGLIKQLAAAEDPLLAIPINALLPHRLARLCDLAGARLIHMSTDCVFSGKRGGYREDDPSDAEDLYGRSKHMGEVRYSNTLTLRTSIIGHELQSAHGLIDWFLSQKQSCKGYTRAIFSGLPTVVLAQVIRDIVIPRTDLSGLFHVAAKPISKYDLLGLVAATYGKSIEITPDDALALDRSLNADRFNAATGYVVPEWSELIGTMYRYYQSAAIRD